MYNDDYMYAIERSDEYLAHYGIRGMKWGVRKARERGNAAGLSRQYAKAQKKLAKLENRAAKADKYKKRAVRMGIGAAAAGGLAAAGTHGVGNALARVGEGWRAGMTGVGSGMKSVGSAVGKVGRLSKNGKVRSIATRADIAMNRAGNAVKNASSGSVGLAPTVLAGKIDRWGRGTDLSKGLQKGIYSGGKYLPAGSLAGKGAVSTTKALNGVSNNTIARIGAGAVGAGLAAGAARNAYKAATAQKKAQQFRSEMNKAFAGTKYANGGQTNRQGKKRARKR